MGSPLGPLMANAFMCNIEEQLTNQNKMPNFYKRYVDDTHSIMPDVEAASTFLSTLRLRSFGVIQVRISDPRSVSIMVHQSNRRVRSFSVIRVGIRDPRSVWIVVHQRNRRIHDRSGFAGSFDAP